MVQHMEEEIWVRRWEGGVVNYFRVHKSPKVYSAKSEYLNSEVNVTWLSGKPMSGVGLGWDSVINSPI